MLRGSLSTGSAQVESRPAYWCANMLLGDCMGDAYVSGATVAVLGPEHLHRAGHGNIPEPMETAFFSPGCDDPAAWQPSGWSVPIMTCRRPAATA